MGIFERTHSERTFSRRAYDDGGCRMEGFFSSKEGVEGDGNRPLMTHALNQVAVTVHFF